MASVAKRVLLKLAARLAAIDGTGAMVTDLGGRVYRRRAVLDVDSEDLPAVFITRRNGGDSRDTKPTGAPFRTFNDVEVIFDVIGVVPLAANSGDAVEDLLADIERALELPNDPCIAAGDTPGAKPYLLGEELSLVSAQVDTTDAASGVEVVAVGVRCVFPHSYGDPDLVET